MAEPACKIDWSSEGYRQVWLYDGTTGTSNEFRQFCAEVASAMDTAASVADLAAAIERTAEGRGLVAQVWPGPSHGDPLRLYVTVGVFTKGSEPAAWR